MVEIQQKANENLDDIGIYGLEAIGRLLSEEKRDHNATVAALETLLIVLTNETVDEEELTKEVFAKRQQKTAQNTERFLQNPQNTVSLMNLLQETDFYIRHPVVQLLTHLLSVKTKEMQDCVFSNPTGIANLIDTLNDSHDVIRNGISFLSLSCSISLVFAPLQRCCSC